MSSPKGSVRIGPITLFTLVIVLFLAVLGALAVTTAQATYAAAEKQASFTEDTYANEAAAQGLVAEIDRVLSGVRESKGNLDAALAAVKLVLPDNAHLDDNTISATFTAQSGRTLAIALEIRMNATYEIISWKATTQWVNENTGEKLWAGTAQTR